MSNLRYVWLAALSTAAVLALGERAEAIKVLMHGREAGPTFRDDPTTFAHLRSVFGMANVDYMQGAVAAVDGSSATGYDVVYISSTMASGDTRNKYEDATVGIVSSENALMHDDSVGNFMLVDTSSNQDMVTDRQKINIVNPSHPLAAGLSGEVTVFNSSTDNWWQFVRSPLAPGAQLIADMVLPAADPPPVTQHAIVAAEVGAQLLGDGTDGRPATAAGRRVFFFLSDFGSLDLTAEGFQLFDAAINWAAADPVPTTGDFDGDHDIDGVDYLHWQRGFGIDDGSADVIDGDSNDDGHVNGEDLTNWKTKFGGTALSVVPEPVGAGWALAALALGACRRNCIGARRASKR
jgi:hypothetical protein